MTRHILIVAIIAAVVVLRRTYRIGGRRVWVCAGGDRFRKELDNE